MQFIFDERNNTCLGRRFYAILSRTTTRMRALRFFTITATLTLGMTWPTTRAYAEDSCPSTTPAPAPAQVRRGIVPGEGPIDITANQAEQNGDISVFSGNVVIHYGTETVTADRVTYNRATDEIEAAGNVQLKNQVGDSLTTPFLQLQRESGSGFSRDIKFRFAQNSSRGEAREVHFHGRELVRLDAARYTRCPQGQDDWFIRASHLELDYTKEIGSAKNARVYFKSIPVLYWPYMTFPLSEKRKSGFLAPVFGTDNLNGFFLTLPYYFNLAPNYDLTVAPKLLSRRGVQWQTETRYLGEKYDGGLNLDYLYNDKVRGIDRELTRFTHHYYLSPYVTTDINLNHVSDKDYLSDFAFSIADAASTYMPEKAEVRYADENWRAALRVFGYQTVDKTVAPENVPYSRLPELVWSNGAASGPNTPAYGDVGDLAYFQHRTKVSGERFGFEPYISWPLRNSYAFFVPKVSARYTAYHLPDINDPSSVVPVASVDSGLIFERDFQLRDRDYVQTLEPRLFYTYIPYVYQDDQPNFDTGPEDFNYSNLFRENRFFGGDRVGDADQVTAGITSRFLDDAGIEWVRLSIGQVYYAKYPRVYTPEQLLVPAPVRNQNRSYLVGQSRIRLGKPWYLRNDIQWDQEQSRTRKSSTYLQYRPTVDSIVNFGHRFVNPPSDAITITDQTSRLEQMELSAQWRVNPRWSLLLKNSYSLLTNSNLESYAGFQYSACCWLGRFYVQQTVNQNNEQKYIYYFEFELSGLLKLGASPIASPLSKGSFIFDD